MSKTFHFEAKYPPPTKSHHCSRRINDKPLPAELNITLDLNFLNQGSHSPEAASANSNTDLQAVRKL